MRIVPCLVWGGNPRNRAERSVSVCCDIPQPQTRQGVCCGLCGGVRLAQVIVPVVAWAPSPLEMTSPVLRARGGCRGCGVGAVPVWVVAGGPTLGTVRLSTRSASLTVPRTFHEKPSGAIFH